MVDPESLELESNFANLENTKLIPQAVFASHCATS